ncbi:hypothetical protein [Catellatospora citrea]|nr:hypothetical protein [Catellatospora citrea]RKE10667.1 hypothetical protein C8E86_5583 [Catellatospora citrea]
MSDVLGLGNGANGLPVDRDAFLRPYWFSLHTGPEVINWVTDPAWVSNGERLTWRYVGENTNGPPLQFVKWRLDYWLEQRPSGPPPDALYAEFVGAGNYAVAELNGDNNKALNSSSFSDAAAFFKNLEKELGDITARMDRILTRIDDDVSGFKGSAAEAFMGVLKGARATLHGLHRDMSPVLRVDVDTELDERWRNTLNHDDWANQMSLGAAYVVDFRRKVAEAWTEWSNGNSNKSQQYHPGGMVNTVDEGIRDVVRTLWVREYPDTPWPRDYTLHGVRHEINIISPAEWAAIDPMLKEIWLREIEKFDAKVQSALVNLGVGFRETERVFKKQLSPPDEKDQKSGTDDGSKVGSGGVDGGPKVPSGIGRGGSATGGLPDLHVDGQGGTRMGDSGNSVKGGSATGGLPGFHVTGGPSVIGGPQTGSHVGGVTGGSGTGGLPGLGIGGTIGKPPVKPGSTIKPVPDKDKTPITHYPTPLSPDAIGGDKGANGVIGIGALDGSQNAVGAAAGFAQAAVGGASASAAAGAVLGGNTGQAATGMGAGAYPFMPPVGMGGAGAQGAGGGKDRDRNTWLAEDEVIWGTDPDDCGPAVVGRVDAVDDRAHNRLPGQPGGRRSSPPVGPRTTTSRPGRGHN